MLSADTTVMIVMANVRRQGGATGDCRGYSVPGYASIWNPEGIAIDHGRLLKVSVVKVNRGREGQSVKD
jgi:hypothetical protein